VTEKDSLSSRQEQLIEGLVGGLTIIAAAQAANVSERQAHRWLKQAEFQRGLKAAQKRVYDYTMMKLLGKVDKAINTLDRNMDARIPHVQVLAASKVLDMAHQQVDVIALEDEVAELKQLLDAKDSNP
jgi:hypothetical protein